MELKDSTTGIPAADPTATTEAAAPAETQKSATLPDSFEPLTAEVREKVKQFAPIIIKRVGALKTFYKQMIEANVPREGKTMVRIGEADVEAPAVASDAFMAFWWDWYLKTDTSSRKGLRYDGPFELECGMNLCHKPGRKFPNVRWLITKKDGSVVLDRTSAIETKDQKPLAEGSYALVEGKAVPVCPACKAALKKANQEKYDALKAATPEGQRPPYFTHLQFHTKVAVDKIASAEKLAAARKAATSEAATKALGSLTKAPVSRPSFNKKRGDRGRR